MLAVSFFFVLTGGTMVFIGLMRLFLHQLSSQWPGWDSPTKKWLVLAGGGMVSLVLGLLMAMT